MIPYKSFRYIFPPRPEHALASTELDSYDNGTYFGQPKLNGDCIEVYTNGIEYKIYDRHKKVYTKTNGCGIDFLSLHRGEKGQWMCLVGEFMAKGKINELGKNFNNNLIIFDIIVYNGIQLVGKSNDERIALLDEMYGTKQSDHKYLLDTEHKQVYRVKTFYKGYFDMWSEVIEVDVYEGWLLKKREALLENGVTETNNTAHMLKFRKPTKNYHF